MFKACKVLFGGLILSLTFYSCNNALEEELLQEKMEPAAENEKVITRSGGDIEQNEYIVLPNPYAIDVMQAVYDENGQQRTLEPTDLYVRFLPADSLQLNSLVDNYGLELFDSPLDIELDEGEVYVDPTREEGDFSWLYTTVKPDFVFPEGIRHEIIEECYIPEDNEQIVSTKAGTSIFVEEAAFEKMGYSIEPLTRAAANPSGTIKVLDDYLNVYVPVKGVRIRCHTLIKWSSTYTDENGHYTITDKKFAIKPYYSIHFKNSRGFSLWGKWGPLAAASHKMGKHEKGGYSLNIDKNNEAWPFAAINNAAYEYYDSCESLGLLPPPEYLKIWRFSNYDRSSTPMLRRIAHFITFRTGNTLADNIKAFYMLIPNMIIRPFMGLLPDITISASSSSTYNGIYETVNHEMSHSSHFSQVGSEYWTDYINYIITYGCYGNGTGFNHELCGIGEMWGYTMGYYLQYRKYGLVMGDKCPQDNIDKWIKTSVFWQLIKNGIMAPQQIFDCLRPEVKTYDSLVEKLYAKCPLKADEIEAVFIANKITPTVEKPENNDVIKDQTIATSSTIDGNNIEVTNVTVTNNATLTLIGNSVTINAPFLVTRNSQINFSLK